MQKRPFLHAYCLADLLLTQVPTTAAHLQRSLKPVQPSWFKGLERLLEVILETRQGYLTQALARLSLQSGQDYSEAFRELERSRQWQDHAQEAILTACEHARRLDESSESSIGHLTGLLSGLRDYCRAVFLSLDHIQRTWVKAGDTETVLTTMYEYLYELYPPKFPHILGIV